MKYLTPFFLLSAAISLIAIGVQTNNIIIICIGGILAGIYDARIQDKIE